MEIIQKSDSMENCNNNNQVSSVARPSRRRSSYWMRKAGWLIFLIIALWPSLTSPAGDSYRDVIQDHMSLETQDATSAGSAQDATTPLTDDEDLTLTLRIEAQSVVGKAEATSEPEVMSTPTPVGFNLAGILALIVGMLVFGILALKKTAPRLFAKLNEYNPWADEPSSDTRFLTKVRAEDESLAKFLTEFKTESSEARPTHVPAVAAALNNDSLATLFTKAALQVASQRKLLQEVGRLSGKGVPLEKLKALHGAIAELRGTADVPELRLVCQVTSALEGLLKQLTDNVGNVSPSTLRTVGGGLDLLEKLCRPGLELDSMASHPLRFLAVDDDLICRTAVSMALKKAFNTPDLAESGETALALASKNSYDVIFLDVQMQGMNGYELCSKIHDTAANTNTPVVFVTCMSDFDARAQSILSGGSDLMGKPFLTFEITVKALTLAIGQRLRSKSEAVVKHNGATSQAKLQPVPPATDNLAPAAPVTPPVAIAPSVLPNPAGLPTDTDHHSHAIQDAATETKDAGHASYDKLEDTFLTRATKQLEALKNLARTISETTDETTRQEMLSEFYLALHSLTPDRDSHVSHPTMRISAALGGLIRKLLESPANWTSSMLLTITNAVDLMDDLCAIGSNSALAVDSPIHILAVDDDPISRRAIVGALQVAFERPVSVEHGEAALAIATELPFDLIFMDVQMPGMDGFEACTKIRQTKANGNTPVVFVTGQADDKTRVQVATCGGNGLIAKPFLTAEVTVKALTSALRGRLERDIALQRSSLPKTNTNCERAVAPMASAQTSVGLIPDTAFLTANNDTPRNRKRRRKVTAQRS